MDKITILSPLEAQKIAAGEVVTRPAHVVKELVENALDAGATAISLYINEAGKKLIRIVDNGCGMSRKDAELCILPHATSKIKNIGDLAALQTFGFRGEALASIAAVARITLKTKTVHQENSSGTQLTIQEQGQHLLQEVACASGTDISIADLFYNTPARKKFLKRDETEWHHIELVMHAFCMSNLNVHVRIYRDGSLTLNAPKANSLKERCGQLWGHNTAENLLAISTQEGKDYAHVRGVISQHQFWRYNRDHIFFFVNNRLVTNKELTKALTAGYQNILPIGRFPAASIHVTIAQSELDVNVHPQKSEVLFAHPLRVANALRGAITQTLKQATSSKIMPSASILTQEWAPNTPTPTILETNNQKLHETASNTAPVHKPFFMHQSSTSWNAMPMPTSELLTLHAAETTKSQQRMPFAQQPIYTIIGQLFATYILIEHNNELIVIDQHAAHERILYEQLKHRFAESPPLQLMQPIIISASVRAQATLLAHEELLLTQGIILTQTSSGQLAIMSAPPHIQHTDLAELIQIIAEKLEVEASLPHEELRKQLYEHVHSHRACKSAVKAGDQLSREEMATIIKDLYACENRYICAHGRPTLWSITKATIEKNVKRRT